jgi:hypothetical protein
MKNEKFCFDKKIGILLLVGILFVVFAFSSQSLLSQQQSTDSKAGKNKLKPAKTVVQKNIKNDEVQRTGQNAPAREVTTCNSNNPLYLSTTGTYSRNNDYCPSNFAFGVPVCQGRLDPLVGCTSSYKSKSTQCCRYGDVYLLGTDKCKLDFPEGSYKDVSCKETCASNETNLSNSDQKKGCAIASVGGTGLTQGYCCGKANSGGQGTQTGQTNVKSSSSDCTSKHIDCTKTLNSNSAVCLGNDSKSWCAYQASGAIACPGTAYVYPVLNQYSTKNTAYCIKEIKEASVKPSNSSSYYCSYALKSISTSLNGQTTTEQARQTECLNSAPTGHTED